MAGSWDQGAKQPKELCFDRLKDLLRPALRADKDGWKKLTKVALHIAGERVQAGTLTWEQVLAPDSSVAQEAVHQAMEQEGLHHLVPLLA